MQIKAKDIKIVPISEIKINPKNRNIHPTEQIQRLAEIIKASGFRNPLIVSNLSGKLVAGHGRLQAAQMLGLEKVPVIYQDFDNAEQEYAASVSDNAIANWATLDLAGINADMPDLGPDFDLELLGIKDFKVDFFEHDSFLDDQPEKEKSTKGDVICPQCGFHIQ